MIFFLAGLVHLFTLNDYMLADEVNSFSHDCITFNHEEFCRAEVRTGTVYKQCYLDKDLNGLCTEGKVFCFEDQIKKDGQCVDR